MPKFTASLTSRSSSRRRAKRIGLRARCRFDGHEDVVGGRIHRRTAARELVSMCRVSRDFPSRARSDAEVSGVQHVSDEIAIWQAECIGSARRLVTARFCRTRARSFSRGAGIRYNPGSRNERASYNGSIEASQASDVGSIPIARSNMQRDSTANGRGSSDAPAAP
jgi:hypothetical protein